MIARGVSIGTDRLELRPPIEADRARPPLLGDHDHLVDRLGKDKELDHQDHSRRSPGQVPPTGTVADGRGSTPTPDGGHHHQDGDAEGIEVVGGVHQRPIELPQGG
ncbi:MAG: hypothetical protein GY713_18520 [Actinomycetia bacterium]|nr:hypothetical protein [Actinomycetes bacterium]